MRTITIQAQDVKSGMSPAEIRAAMHEIPSDARVRVLTGWRGQIKSVVIQLTR